MDIYSNQEIYKVSGPSLEADFIFDGDYIVVDPDLPIQDDDIVVAKTVDQLLIKHFSRENGHQKFYPFHPTNPFMYIDDAQVMGKIVTIVCPGSHDHASH